MVNRVFAVYTTSNGIVSNAFLDGDCIKLDGKIYTIEKICEHKEGRHPSLGWNELTVIEAKADGAQQCLVHKNIDGAYDRLSDVLKYCRELISRKKKQGARLHFRCQEKDWIRSKCGKYPAKFYKEFNMYLCEGHYTKRMRL